MYCELFMVRPGDLGKSTGDLGSHQPLTLDVLQVIGTVDFKCPLKRLTKGGIESTDLVGIGFRNCGGQHCTYRMNERKPGPSDKSSDYHAPHSSTFHHQPTDGRGAAHETPDDGTEHDAGENPDDVSDQVITVTQTTDEGDDRLRGFHSGNKNDPGNKGKERPSSG